MINRNSLLKPTSTTDSSKKDLGNKFISSGDLDKKLETIVVSKLQEKFPPQLEEIYGSSGDLVEKWMRDDYEVENLPLYFSESQIDALANRMVAAAKECHKKLSSGSQRLGEGKLRSPREIMTFSVHGESKTLERRENCMNLEVLFKKVSKRIEEKLKVKK